MKAVGLSKLNLSKKLCYMIGIKGNDLSNKNHIT